MSALSAMLVLALVLAGPQEEADSASASAARLDARLAEARAALATRKFALAKDTLVAAVREHEGPEEEVLHRWFELEDGLEQASFWSGYKAPKPAAVVRGELVDWDPESGKIKLRYRTKDGGFEAAKGGDAEQRGDFVLVDDVLLHPMVFKGPYQIELKGDDLEPGDEFPIVFAAWEWNSLRGIDYGSAYAVLFADMTRVYELRWGELQGLDSSSNMLRYGRPYTFTVRVASSSVTASYNGSLLCKAERATGPYGQFGFNAFDNLDEVVITGEAEPAWIAGLVDERVQADREAFRARFDPFEGLPAWVKERVEGEGRRAAAFGYTAPEPRSPTDSFVLEKSRAFDAEGEAEEALDYLRALPTADIRDELRDWLLAYFLCAAGELEEGSACLERVCRLDPQFFEARFLRAKLAAATSSEAAIGELEALAIDFPTVVDVHEDLVLHLLALSRPTDAAQALEVAIDNGVPARALARAGAMVLRTRHGPSWGKTYSAETKHYRVHSDASENACFEIARELERFYQKYVIHVRRPETRASEKAQVYFFSGERGYHAYTEGLLGSPAENTLGLYSPWLKQLVLWNSPNRATVLRTARHEGFHQYLDQISDDAPVWLNEGLAEYFEQAELVDGKWRDDQVNQEHVALLGHLAEERTPLRDFVLQDDWAFRRKSGLHYPEAWAFVHFLENGGKEHSRRLDTLLDALAEGADGRAAVEQAFAGVDWARLESEFERYLVRLR